jgi:hypothetical protein
VAPSHALVNAATRAYDSWTESFDDLDVWAGHCTDDIVLCDRRPVVGAGLELVGREAAVEAVKGIHEVGARPAESTHLAVRGERLSLTRRLWVGDTGEVEVLQVIETAEDGRVARTDTFDPGQLDEAMILLDERFLAGEGEGSDAWQVTVEGSRASNARDWAHLRRLLDDEFVLVDHRLMGFDDLDADQYVAVSAALVEQAPDARWTIVSDHGTDRHRICLFTTSSGSSADGGPFLNAMYAVLTERDRLGVRMDTFSTLDEAREHFGGLD